VKEVGKMPGILACEISAEKTRERERRNNREEQIQTKQKKSQQNNSTRILPLRGITTTSHVRVGRGTHSGRLGRLLRADREVSRQVGNPRGPTHLERVRGSTVNV